MITMASLILPLTVVGNNVKKQLNIHPYLDINVAEVDATVHTYYIPEHKEDGVHKVVIDAGHGGHDPGCRGAHSNEKDIALSIAKLLGKSLAANYPDVEVIYTRDSDVFIPLHQRIGLANNKKADIFLSIHCNYVGNPNICGSETYVMGLHRAQENLNVAKRENAVVLLEDDFEANYEGYDPNSPIGHILLSAMQNLHLDQSIELASTIEEGLVSRGNYDSRGVKQAGFVVLRQATMPSVLVETGFLSNPREEKYLMSDAGQQEIADKLENSVTTYFDINKASAKQRKVNVAVTPQETTTDISCETCYTIQLGVYSTDDPTRFEDELLSLGRAKITSVGSVYRYTIGRYSSRDAADSALKSIHATGLTEAYIRKL